MSKTPEDARKYSTEITRPNLIEMCRHFPGDGSPQQKMESLRRGLDMEFRSGNLEQVSEGRNATIISRVEVVPQPAVNLANKLQNVKDVWNPGCVSPLSPQDRG